MSLSISDLFDESFYLVNNPDVAEAVRQGFFISGFEHFIQFGQFEVVNSPSRNPSPLFDEAFYLTNNPDVAEAVRQGFFPNGFQHFIQFGQFELGNSPTRSPSFLFDEAYYLANNPDVLSAVKASVFNSGFEHFIRFGQFEADTTQTRNPSIFYNERFYLEHNSDVAAAVASGSFASGFRHFVFFGIKEGRTAINTPPVAGSESFTVDEDTLTLLPSLLANDSDRDGDPLVIAGFTSPAHGSLTTNTDGTFSYTPELNYEGTDSFTYTVSDGYGGVASSTVTITINPSPDTPVAGNDAFTTNEDTALSFTSTELLRNDFDPEGDTFFFDNFVQPANGTVEGLGNGTFIYNPKSNFNGTDSFTYTITDGNGTTVASTVNLTVRSVNDVPIAGNDTFSTNEDTEVSFSRATLLSNDTDADGNPILITGFTQPLNGRLVDLGGSYIYTPKSNFNGTDTFTYTITDGRGGNTTAVVTLNVNAINDAPIAGNDIITTNEDTSVTFTQANLLLNDSDADQDTPLITSFSQPGRGVLASSNGSLTYTPTANFSGSDSFTYVVTDGKGSSTTATVTLVVNSVQDIPVANNDAFTTSEDTELLITPNELLRNDSDADQQQLLINSFGPALNGAIRDNGNQTFTYTPSPNFNGSDSFTYTITDGSGGTATATVNVNVTSVNDIPVASSDAVTTNEDSLVLITNVLTNDRDADQDAIAIISFTQPSSGTVDSRNNGSFNYIPNPDFNGSDSFTYTISDGRGGSTTGVVNITVNAVNDLPIANSDTASTNEDTQATIVNVLANDSDIEGDTFFLSSSTSATNGQLIDQGNGTFRYTPNTNFNGTDSFTYTITDSNGGSASATVNITVNAVNDAPIAISDTASTTEDTQVNIPVLTNDTDAEGDVLSVSNFSLATKGSLSQNNGVFTYTPNANANGTDSFTYTISDGNGGSASATVNVTITPVNDAPIAISDTASTPEDTQVNIPVLTNDTDVEGNPLSITGVSVNPTRGSVVNNNGVFTYTPNANVNGTDSFTYTISDGNGGSASATVNITVNAVNDAPIAISDTASTPEDTVVTINAFANDTDAENDVLSVSNFSLATKGSLSQNNGVFTYTPNANANGTDSFTYTISDGNGGSASATVNITVNAVNDAPIAISDTASTPEDTQVNIPVLTNDTDVEGNPLSITGVSVNPTRGSVVNNNGVFTYTPNANANGSDSFTYTISDGNGGSASATVNVTITPVNDAPIAISDTASTTEDTQVNIPVLTNDTDVEGNPLSITGVSVNPTRGSVVSNNGVFTYTPNANANGTDSFTYTIGDGNGGSASATVNVTITPVNDAPIANSDTVTTNEDTVVTIAALANDTDVEGNTLSITGNTNPANGSVISNNGTFRYTPTTNFNGSDSFTYTISDGNGGTASATVNITVAAVNDLPKASADLLVVDATTSTTIIPGTLLANDTDVEGTLTIASTTQPTRGSLEARPDGTYVYNATSGANGSDSFTYTVSDGAGGNATATVNLIVAQSIDSNFSLAANENITAATTIPHTSVSVRGDGSFDYYSFIIGSASGQGSVQGIFDIDFADQGGTAALDTEIFLFDNRGTLLATNDDAGSPDAGSSSLNDSYLTYNFNAPGRYVIGVAKVESTNTIGSGITGTPLTANDSYTLNVSIENHFTV
ncbi:MULTISPECIES: S-layer family protein [Trichocoleus]|uniref:Tandem-95 repeat protein n=1 Tax=Trichocoleus desertorum GB2-A4 TaxID=2933944 RepID=A0ABV0J802_9CYAN|nr:tandem-95 repeat protein [Trichocoleus sp. FACHB-46]MBD1863355.1 tandem-95 repeat protein [Trichocoleus sp. FACHB-46]